MKEKKEKTVANGASKMRKIIPWLCVALGVLVVSLLCDIYLVNSDDVGETEEEQIELTLVYAFQNTQWNAAVETLIEEFEEAYPNIKINYEVSYEDKVYEDVLTKQVARNEMGDIVQLKTPEAYAAVGLLAEISPEVAALVPYLYTYEEAVYGVGAVESTWGVLYNKNMFNTFNLKEPQTYDEFIDLCRSLKRRGITAIGVGGYDLWHMEYWVNHFFRTDMLSVDGDWLKNCSLGLAFWTDDEAYTMMSHLYELFNRGYVNDKWLTTTDTSLAYKMSEGEVGMIYTGPWTAAAIESINSDIDLGWFYVPNDSGEIYASDNLDTFWSVTTECAEDEAKYEAAMTFLTYFYSEEVYARFCAISCTFPLTDITVDYEEGSVYEDVWTSFCSADYLVSTYIGNEDTPEEFEKSMLELVREVLNGTYTVEEGLTLIQQSWEQSE